jgi:hypothetical protein
MNATLADLLATSGGRVSLKDANAVRPRAEELARLAVFGGPDERDLARYVIQEAAPELGAVPASIQGLYMARGRGEVSGFTVPAVNIRGMAYDMSRALFRAIQATDGAATVFELARSEMGYTHQDPAELAAVVLAAAIAEGYQGPVFIQETTSRRMRRSMPLTRRARLGHSKSLSRGRGRPVLNIDIDASTLVDLSFETVAEQQAPNSVLTARLAQHVRALEPDGVTISIGGEIGEVGKHNSTVEELIARTLTACADGRPEVRRHL